MNRAQALTAAFVGGLLHVPTVITQLTLRVDHTPDAVGRGVSDRVAAEVAQSLEAALPLFAAGFCAANIHKSHAAAGITGAVDRTTTGFTLRIDGASHSTALPYLLVRLIEAHSQTPAGAYQRLLDLLDGDEKEAQSVFKPLSLAADVSAIDMHCAGAGSQQALDLLLPPDQAHLDPLARAIPRDVARLIFDLPQGGRLDTKIEHGFLTLNDQGCFHALGTLPGDPELFVRGRELIINGWDGDAVFLAALVSVVAMGQVSAVQVRSEDDAG